MNYEKLFADKKTILLCGETGTGKSSFARNLHLKYGRQGELFHEVNLATIKSDLIESEIFGHIKGAFTSACQDHVGRLELAMNGTVFLDEVGELSLESQKKFLSLLDDGSYFPVGSGRKKIFRGRFILATNKNLVEMIKNEKFRSDLYFRISTHSVRLKSLAGQKTVIQNYLESEFEKLGFTFSQKFSPEAQERLFNYTYPGNFREIKSFVEYVTYHLDQKREIVESDLAPCLLGFINGD